jgi:hypothetical protein
VHDLHPAAAGGVLGVKPGGTQKKKEGQEVEKIPQPEGGKP